MKTTQKRWLREIQHTMTLGVLALMLSGLFGITCVTSVAYAQNHSYSVGWHNAIAYLAEKEVKREQQIRAASSEIETAQNTVASKTDDTTCSSKLKKSETEK